jgi:hypothetical protein
VIGTEKWIEIGQTLRELGNQVLAKTLQSRANEGRQDVDTLGILQRENLTEGRGDADATFGIQLAVRRGDEMRHFGLYSPPNRFRPAPPGTTIAACPKQPCLG